VGALGAITSLPHGRSSVSPIALFGAAPLSKRENLTAKFTR
jgi:hypothetical protein